MLHGISLTVDPGEVVVMLGANGAGKTTTMRAIAGLIGRRGSVSIGGAAVRPGEPGAAVAAGLALVPQGRGTFTKLTVAENLLVGASGGVTRPRSRGTSSAGMRSSRYSPSGPGRRRAPCLAASSRCLPSPGR